MTQAIPQLRSERTIRTGPFDVTVSIPLALAERLRNGALYQRLVEPLVGRRGNATPRVPARRRPPLEPIAPVARALWERVGAVEWYDSIDLGHGVVTPGIRDVRDQVALYGLPDSLAGLRVLDLCTADGFWAFELERRGADVVALDPPADDLISAVRADPTTQGPDRGGDPYSLAREALCSRVVRVHDSVYRLEAERIGTFDIVFMNDVLQRVRCPQRVIESAAAVCRGDLVVSEVFHRALEDVGGLAIAEYKATEGSWWVPNVQTLATMMNVAGCEPVEELSRFRTDRGTGGRTERVVLRGTVTASPQWLRDLRAWAERTPPKWKSAAEQQR